VFWSSKDKINRIILKHQTKIIQASNKFKILKIFKKGINLFKLIISLSQKMSIHKYKTNNN